MPDPNGRARWPDPTGRGVRARLITTGRQPGRLTRGIDAAHLHRDRGDSTGTDDQDHHQRGDGQGRLDGGETTVTG